MKKLILSLAAVALLASCTENYRVKNMGGNGTIKLPVGQKLVNVTWKDTELWYITRPMTVNDYPETYTLKEKSSYGIVEGSYTIIETK
jgi:hypothetical protein